MLLRQRPPPKQNKTPSSPHRFNPTAVKLRTSCSASPCCETSAQRSSADSSHDCWFLLFAADPGVPPAKSLNTACSAAAAVELQRVPVESLTPMATILPVRHKRVEEILDAQKRPTCCN
mmetsp:Transcript_26918/g.70774  ORF Transcript_26918/g.70774 Transcript_26918/m.70774 type:complete len:119 (-) Transcript_26918:2884-3240(-)